jgi:hypothetical protein
MSDESLINASCKLNPETMAVVDQLAERAGLSRSECLRQLIMAGIEQTENSLSTEKSILLSQNPIMLLQHILYCIQRIHSNQHQIAHMTGALSEEDLDLLGHHTIEQGINFLAHLEERMAKTRNDLAAVHSAK